MEYEKNPVIAERIVISNKQNIQSGYEDLGEEDFIKTFEKIKNNSYLQKQLKTKNIALFFKYFFNKMLDISLGVYDEFPPKPQEQEKTHITAVGVDSIKDSESDLAFKKFLEEMEGKDEW